MHLKTDVSIIRDCYLFGVPKANSTNHVNTIAILTDKKEWIAVSVVNNKNLLEEFINNPRYITMRFEQCSLEDLPDNITIFGDDDLTSVLDFTKRIFKLTH